LLCVSWVLEWAGRHTHGNVLAYGRSSGLKSDFGGHDLQHMNNLYLFPASCAVLAMGMDSFFMQGHECVFARNDCVLGGSQQYAGAFTCTNASRCVLHTHTFVSLSSAKTKPDLTDACEQC
jgi:hypothetical protein